MTSGQITMDIVEVSGRTVESVKVLGLLPGRCYQDGEDFNIYVRWAEGNVVRADRSDTDQMIVAESTLPGKIKGFGNLMQSLADHYGATVVVRTDPGVSGGQSGKLVGTWEPTVTVTTAEARVKTYAAKHKLTSPADLSLMVDELTTGETETMAAVDAVKVSGKVWASKADRTGLPVEAFDLAVSRGLLAVYGRGEMRRFMLPYQGRTVDGVEITDGLAVWDYNIEPGRVDLSTLGDDGWFHVLTADGGYSLMNAERVVTRHPRTRMLASDVLATMANPAPSQDCESAPVGTFSDRDLRDQVIEYLGSDVDGFYVDGIVDTIIKRHNGAVPVDTMSEAEFAKILWEHVNPTEAEVWAGTGTLIDGAEADMECCNECTWDRINRQARENLRLVKRPMRAKLARRARKAVRRGIKGGC